MRRAIAGFLVVVMSAFLTLTGLAPTSAAPGDRTATITKQLAPASQQGPGFTAPDTFEAGAQVKYLISFQCSSLVAACETGTVKDVLDPRLEYVNVFVNGGGTTVTTPHFDPATNTFTADISNFQDGTPTELTLIAKVKDGTPAGTIPNTATIQIPEEADKTTPPVVIQVPDADPSWDLTKSVISPAGSPSVDSTVTYRINLKSTGTDPNVPIKLATITDTIPPGSVFVSASNGSDNTAPTEVGGVITWANVGPIAVGPAGWTATVTVRYPSPTFAPGQTVINNVDSDVTYANDEEEQDHAEAPVTFAPPVPDATVTKVIDGGVNEAAVGAPIAWAISGTNTGNTTLIDPTVTDENLPTDFVDQLKITAKPQVGDWPDYPTVYEQKVAGAWIPLAVYNGAPGIEVYLDPAATGIRAFPLSGTTDPGQKFGEIFLSGVVKDVPESGRITNCAGGFANGGALTMSDDCVSTTITSAQAALGVVKNAVDENGQGSLIVTPGQEFEWAIGVVNSPSGTPLDRFVVTDVLPAGFEFVSVTCAGFVANGGGTPAAIKTPCTGASAGDNIGDLGAPTIDPANPQLLTWDVDLASGDFGNTTLRDQPAFRIWINVKAKDGVSVGSYTNEVQVVSPIMPTSCIGGVASTDDTHDIDGDGNTSEKVCKATDTVDVAAAAIIDAAKYDQGTPGQPFVDQTTGQPRPASSPCPDVNGYTRYPCVAQTIPGGPLSYRFMLRNIGNVTATDYVMYDILPTVGDTGVSQTLAGSQRQTEWVPVLTGPLSVVDAPSGAAPVVLYNKTSNPCRPELNEGTADGSWQATCDDNWFTAAEITDWTSVKSFKISAFTADGAAWQPLDQMVFQADLKAPLDAPQSTETPLDLSIAWNSFAHREFRLNADGTKERLLPSEPRKVGIIVPFVVPDAYAVGDYVWYDDNHDGIQDTSETPVAGVTVTLLDGDGKPALDAAGSPVPPTMTDSNGHYVFDNLPPGTYKVRFSDLPAGYETTLQNSGGDQVAPKDSNVPPALTDTATTPSFTIGANDAGMDAPIASDKVTVAVGINRTIDMGIVRIPDPVYAVGDYVWFDDDNDGVQDTSEEPVEGVTVKLFDNDGNEVATTTTDADGHYIFDNLPAGTYTVEFSDLPAGYETTLQNNAGDQVAPNDSNVPAKLTGSAKTPPFTIGATETGMAPVDEAVDGVTVAQTINRTIDMGLVRPVYAVGDYVWYDDDQDGLQDSDEKPVVGVIVTLLDKDGNPVLDADGKPVASTKTDDNGHYVFDNLPAGSYIVRFSDLPSGFESTWQNNNGGQVAADDSNVPAGLTGVATTPVFTIGAGESGMADVVGSDGVTEADHINRTIDMGISAVAVPAISIVKFINDDDANVKPGVKVVEGSTMQVKMVVKNTGKVKLDPVKVTDDKIATANITCPKTALAVGEEMTCTATYPAPAPGVQHTNTATVTGTPPSTPGNPNPKDVTDDDPANAHVPAAPAVTIVKYINDDDANVKPGVTVAVGSTMNIKMVVTNSGNVKLDPVVVSDDKIATANITCPKAALAVGESMTCTATYPAPAFGTQHTNTATVVGTGPDGTKVTDNDPANAVVKGTPAVSIVKYINGDDADTSPGVEVEDQSNMDVTMLVTNTGQVDLNPVVVTDDTIAASDISCPKAALAPGESMTCVATYPAPKAGGKHRNVATVTGAGPDGTVVTDANEANAHVVKTAVLGITEPTTKPDPKHDGKPGTSKSDLLPNTGASSMLIGALLLGLGFLGLGVLILRRPRGQQDV